MENPIIYRTLGRLFRKVLENNYTRWKTAQAPLTKSYKQDQKGSNCIHNLTVIQNKEEKDSVLNKVKFTMFGIQASLPESERYDP